MSIEYQGVLSPPLTKLQIAELFRGLAALKGWVTVRRTNLEIGLGLQQSGDHSDVGELVSVALTSEEVYIGFHCCHGLERERILQAITIQLTKSGVSCNLSEQ
jgi:hypothetical protein